MNFHSKYLPDALVIGTAVVRGAATCLAAPATWRWATSAWDTPCKVTDYRTYSCQDCLTEAVVTARKGMVVGNGVVTNHHGPQALHQTFFRFINLYTIFCHHNLELDENFFVYNLSHSFHIICIFNETFWQTIFYKKNVRF